MSTTPGIDDQLQRLEEDIRRLKVEFDIFFVGGSAKPPTDTKYRVENQIKRLYEARNVSFGQRFRYNSLVSRYNVYRELWRRNLKEKEEGGRDMPLITETPAAAARGFSPSTVRCSDPTNEPEKVRELYDSLITAKRQCGERVQNLPYDRFEQMISAQVRQIKDQLKCEAIEFTVEVDDGSVKFKAKAGT